jgi:uncharacterized RDD family membrane protein YckC
MEKPSVLRRRVYALTTDLGIIVATNAFMVSAFNQFTRTVFFHLPFKMQFILIHNAAYMASISMMALTFAYFSLFYFCTNGRTLGKTFFGLRAVNSDKSEMTLKQSMYRAFAYFTCAMAGSFLFALSYIRKDEKSLADIFSKMTVSDEYADATDVLGTEFQMELNNIVSLARKKSSETQEEVEYFEQNSVAKVEDENTLEQKKAA